MITTDCMPDLNVYMLYTEIRIPIASASNTSKISQNKCTLCRDCYFHKPYDWSAKKNTIEQKQIHGQLKKISMPFVVVVVVAAVAINGDLMMLLWLPIFR